MIRTKLDKIIYNNIFFVLMRFSLVFFYFLNLIFFLRGSNEGFIIPMIHLSMNLRVHYFLKFDGHSQLLRASPTHLILEHCEELEGLFLCLRLILHFQKEQCHHLNLTDNLWIRSVQSRQKQDQCKAIFQGSNTFNEFSLLIILNKLS